MNLCITINLKNKFQKYNNLKIVHYEEKRLANINYFDIKAKVKNQKLKNIIIEYKCIDSLEQLKKFSNCMGNINIIITGFETKEINLGEFTNNYIDLKSQDHIQKIIKLCKKKYKRKGSNNRENQKEKTKYISSYKTPEPYKVYEKKLIKDHLNLGVFQNERYFENTILAISLDRKVYATTYLIILSMLINQSKRRKIYFLEKKQSLVNIEELIQLNKIAIKYKKFSIIDNELLNEKNLQIIDLGLIDDIETIRQLLEYKYKKILVFTTDCLKVLENTNYIRMYRLLEKHNNIVFINRKDIFDRKIQEKSKYYKSKKVKSNIKKNNLIKEIDV